jgi:hypothetical protein
MTKDILKHIDLEAIAQIEQKRPAYRVREIVQADKKLSEEEKQNIFKDLKL